MKIKSSIFNVLVVSIALNGLASGAAQAATFSLSGNARVGTNLYNNLDARSGTLPDEGNTSSYLESRFLLRPDVVIDDRFQIKSEWLLLQTPAPSAQTDTAVPEGFGSSLDGLSNAHNGRNFLYMRRAYLNWASDWGIFTFGRMPKSWGLGLLYDAGLDPLDDFGTTVDRAGFQAMLGNLVIGLGYEKGAESSLNNENDDGETYELSLEYSNPESLLDVGLLYLRKVSSGVAETFLGDNSHDLSFYSRKRWGQLQVGGELASRGQEGRENAFGALVQADYMPGDLKMNVDVAYANATNDSAFTFHPNYQPMLMLFRQSIGPKKAGAVRGGINGGNAVGAPLAAGDGAGAMLVKGGFAYGFSNSTYVLGTDLGYATLARQGSNPSKSLGVEWDLNFTQKWYDNFKTFYSFGLLFPGSAFGATQVAWGFQIRGALTF